MASYTVTGHPLNYNDIGVSGAERDAIENAIKNVGVGQTVTITLSGPNDTKAKGHGCIR